MLATAEVEVASHWKRATPSKRVQVIIYRDAPAYFKVKSFIFENLTLAKQSVKLNDRVFKFSSPRKGKNCILFLQDIWAPHVVEATNSFLKRQKTVSDFERQVIINSKSRHFKFRRYLIGVLFK